jgi:hypothetical protein
MEAEIARMDDANLDKELSCAEAAGPEAAENAALWIELLRAEKDRRARWSNPDYVGNPSFTDLELDLRARWLPSDEQRADAEAQLKAGNKDVYTVQILRNKSYGLWDFDVVVECPRAIFFDRDDAALYVLTLVYKIRTEGGTATGGYSHHYLDGAGNEQAAVFEDIMTWDKANS